jgi:recombination protein RecT
MTATTTLSNIRDGEKPATPLATLKITLDRLKSQIALALPKHLNADRMARLALTAFSTTPQLQSCTTRSIYGSLMTAAQLGLEPGVNGQGYLIPYGKTCQFVPGWKGLVDLVARAGRASVWTGAVFDGDDFDYQMGDRPFVRHRPNVEGDEWKFAFVYAIGRVRDAQMPVIEVWSRAKVEKHLKTYNKVGDRHYAMANENNLQMYGRKVALLQVLKYMPQSVELNQAIEISNAADSGTPATIDVEGMVIVDQDAEEVAHPANKEHPDTPSGCPSDPYVVRFDIPQGALPIHGDALDAAIDAARKGARENIMSTSSIPDRAAELINALAAAKNTIETLRSVELQTKIGEDRFALNRILEEAKGYVHSGFDLAFGIAGHVQELAEKRIKSIMQQAQGSAL